MAIHQIQTSFNAGELSPLLDARAGVEKYANGCRRLKNFMVSVHGPIIKRPGMEYMGPAGLNSRRLTGLNFGSSDFYVMEWCQGLWRWWKNGQLLAFTLAHPYANAHLEDIQLAQVNDVIYMVHPEYAPAVLERYGDLDWRHRELHTQAGALVGWPAMLDENFTPVTITPSGTALGASITLTASAALFTAQHVNSWWQIAHRRASSVVDIICAVGPFPAAVSASMRVIGNYTVTSYGFWNTTLYLEQLQTDGTWATIRNWSSVGERNITDTDTAETEATLRLRVDAGGSTAAGGVIPNPRFTLEATDARVYGLVRITGYTSPTQVSATVWSPIQAATATPLWTEGAFSPRQGHPRTVCMHQQRLYFGGTRKNPQNIWASVTGDFENFRRSSLDDGSFFRMIASENSFSVNWLLSQGDLIIGTSGDEWVGTVPQDAGVTPLNLTFRRQSANGSDYRQALLIREAVIYTQRNGLALSRMSYQDTGRYGSADLSILASHLFRGRIANMAWQAQPSSVLWIVLRTGRIVGLTYEESQNVFACHEHITDGLVKSVAVIHGTASDEVWFLVERDGVRNIERFNPGTLGAGAFAGTMNGLVNYLDAAVGKSSGAPFTTVSGLGHLEGRMVSVYADGAQQDSRMVSGGMVTLDTPASLAAVGLPYLSELQPMRLEAQLQNGTAQGRKFKLVSAVVRLIDSLGGQVRGSLTEDSIPEVIQYREVGDPMDAPPPLFTGDKTLTPESRHGDSLDLAVQHSEPLPFTLVALAMAVDIYD